MQKKKVVVTNQAQQATTLLIREDVVVKVRDREKNVDLQHHMEQGMNGLHGNRWILQNRQTLLISRLKKIDRVVPSAVCFRSGHRTKNIRVQNLTSTAVINPWSRIVCKQR